MQPSLSIFLRIIHILENRFLPYRERRNHRVPSRQAISEMREKKRLFRGCLTIFICCAAAEFEA
jgi:hypothetical protein